MTTWPEIQDSCTVFADDHVLVLNKPPGVSVVGERHGTDLMRLAREAGAWLMPAHRIDKVTSGAVLLARSPEVHADLARQFNRRSVEKAYLAVVRSAGLPEHGRIELPLSVGRKSRVRVAAPREAIAESGGRWSVPAADVFTTVRTYPSVTTFATVWQDGRHALLAVRPVTGRRHQLRVHLAWTGHPIEGDPLFQRAAAGEQDRTRLHSWRLAFDAEWSDGSRIPVVAEPDADFLAPVRDRLSVPAGDLLVRAAEVLDALDADPA